MSVQITIPEDKIAEFCRRNRIRRLLLFGSVLRADFGPDSDIDVLVEFEEGARISYFDLVDIQDALAVMLGRAVDIGTPESLSPYLRDRVLDSAQVIYERW